METKSFIGGLVCGGVAFAIIDALVLDDPELQPQQGSANDAVADSAPRQREVSPERFNDSSTENALVEVTVSARGQPPVASQAVPDAVTPPNAATNSARQNWFDSARSRLATEQRDVSWSPFSEQALQQFWGNHQEASQLALEYIECAATTCQIAVAGADERAHAILQGILYDMRQQPWFEFGQTGISAGGVDGRYMLVAEMHRVQSGQE